MKRLLLIAGLLSGCGQTPAAPPTDAFAPARDAGAIENVVEAPAAETRDGTYQHQPDAGPRPGVWALSYRLAGETRTEELPLRFLADGTVAVAGLPAVGTDAFPNQWDADEATFEGRVRPDPLNRSAVSRDRLDLDVETPTAMHGTLAMRVNFRWIPLPVTARFVRPLEAVLSVTPGTIVDGAEAERFD
jgi:hypothetical protein